MTDPSAFLPAGEGLAGLWAAKKVLGPSLDEVGTSLASWSQRRLENVGRVVDKAASKLRDDDDGAVPARVAVKLLEEASWTDDKMMAEYLGGVLAASHVKGGQDDRGASMAALVARLSTVQVKTHYLVHEAVRRRVVGEEIAPNLRGVDVYVTASAFAEFLGLPMSTVEEVRELNTLALHAVTGLHRERLCADGFGVGTTDVLKPPSASDETIGWGIRAGVSHVGIELYLWAHGYRMAGGKSFANPDLEFALSTDVPLPEHGIWHY